MITIKYILSIPNMQRLKLISIFISVLLSQNLFAARALPEFSARYAIEKFDIKLAEAHYRLRYTKSGYEFSQDTKPFGVASMFANDTISATSLIDEVGDNLLLTKHNYRQTGREKNKDEDINILWQTYKNMRNGNITGVVRNKKISLKTNSEVWEALSFQIPLMIEADKNIKEYPYKAILKGEIETYNFVLTSTKKIRFANKEYQTLHLVHTDPRKNRQLHIWLVPALHNIPVIIEYYREGKQHSRAQLESVQFNDEKPITL